MTEILLLRHGKSDWSFDVGDYDRPLTDRGKRSAQRIGAWLQSHALIPEAIWSSPAKRAQETTEKTIKVMGKPVSEIVTIPALYEATHTGLLDVIEQAKQQSNRTLIVGHNPSMEMVLESLVGDQIPETDDGKIMATATLAYIQFHDHKPILKQLIRPKTLPKLFAVPTSEGLTYADRPAYYYQQSGVIPYRFLNGELQVLLITKSSKTKWGIPKGIIEPGYSAVESAMKEAHEEAGVIGEVSLPMLGQYQHAKWGGICDISVYPMEVTQWLEGDTLWESHKRLRQWFNIENAIKQLENEDVQDLVMMLAEQLEQT
jgi:phosphohistidine phosphatase